MDRTLQREIKGYLRRIRHNLPFFHKVQKTELMALQRGIGEYLFLFPDASMEDILCEFGTWEEVVSGFLEDTSPEEQIKRYHRKEILHSFLFLLIFLLSFWFIRMAKRKS